MAKLPLAPDLPKTYLCARVVFGCWLSFLLLLNSGCFVLSLLCAFPNPKQVIGEPSETFLSLDFFTILLSLLTIGLLMIVLVRFQIPSSCEMGLRQFLFPLYGILNLLTFLTVRDLFCLCQLILCQTIHRFYDQKRNEKDSVAAVIFNSAIIARGVLFFLNFVSVIFHLFLIPRRFLRPSCSEPLVPSERSSLRFRIPLVLISTLALLYVIYVLNIPHRPTRRTTSIAPSHDVRRFSLSQTEPDDDDDWSSQLEEWISDLLKEQQEEVNDLPLTLVVYGDRDGILRELKIEGTEVVTMTLENNGFGINPSQKFDWVVYLDKKSQIPEFETEAVVFNSITRVAKKGVIVCWSFSDSDSDVVGERMEFSNELFVQEMRERGWRLDEKRSESESMSKRSQYWCWMFSGNVNKK